MKKITVGTILVFGFLIFLLSYTIRTSSPPGRGAGDVVGIQSAVTPIGSSISASPVSSVSAHRLVRVVAVVDGDTIKIDSGQTVRYIGIDTPETVHPNKPVACFGKEASEKNKELVLGRAVGLERDVSLTDRYGRLLAYIWLEDMMVNEYLVREGYAFARTFPPDVRYQSRLAEAERVARTEGKGLWGKVCASAYSASP